MINSRDLNNEVITLNDTGSVSFVATNLLNYDSDKYISLFEVSVYDFHYNNGEIVENQRLDKEEIKSAIESINYKEVYKEIYYCNYEKKFCIEIED